MRRQNRRRGNTVVPPDPDNPGGDIPAGPAASGALVKFSTTVTTRTAVEIPNPLRGLFDWNGSQDKYYASGQIAPVPEPPAAKQVLREMYERDDVVWRLLEPSFGVYTGLDHLDQRAAIAKARGGKYGFRIMCYGHPPDRGASMPTWMQGGIYGGQNSGASYWPDFNNNNFLTRVEALLAAIGARFGNDLRFGMCDIGIYGTWGEWHTYNSPAPNPGSLQINLASAQRIIDCHVAALPHADWTMSYGSSLVSDALHYAMNKVTTAGKYVGWRNDALGTQGNGNAQASMPAWTQGPGPMVDQWKRAIIVGETTNISTSGDGGSLGTPNTWANAAGQVKTYHYSMVGDGNTSVDYPVFSTAEQQNWVLAGKNAGYRLELRGLTMPSVIEAGSHATVRCNWINTGVAPLYQSWQVKYLLKDTSGTVVWTRTSGRDFKFFLPAGTTEDTFENFNMPSNLPAGTLTMCVKVTDPSGYYTTPLALAISGRASDGSYPVGTITVPSSSGPTTTLSAPLVTPAIAGSGAGLRTVGSATRLKLKGLAVWGMSDYITINNGGFAASEYANRDAVCSKLISWGANCLRLRVLADEYTHNVTLTKAQYKQQVVDWWTSCTTAGLYLDLCSWDPLDSSDGTKSGANWATQYNYAFTMWADLHAALVTANGGTFPTNVFYEPHNEPNNITDVQWLTAMQATIVQFRTTMGYQGLLLLDSNVWSHTYDDTRFTTLEAYDAARTVSTQHNLAFASHRYHDDDPTGFSSTSWIANTGGSSTAHVVIEGEFGNFNAGSVDTTWSAAATTYWKTHLFDRANIGGGIAFLFGNWDANGTSTDLLGVTPSVWGANVQNWLAG